MPKLVVFRGEAIEAEIQIGAGACLRIGRDKQNDVVLDDPERGVSRFHAEVRSEGGVYTIVDVGSRNGIWLNGQAIKQVTLKPGVLVAVGPFEVMLEEHLSTAMFGSSPGTAIGEPETHPNMASPHVMPPGPATIIAPPPTAAVSPSTTVQVRLTAAWSDFATMARGVGMGALQDRRQMMLWSGAAVVLIVLVVGGVMIVRRTPASELRTAENNTSTATTSVPFTPPSPDPNTEVIAQHLSAGRDALAAGRREDALRELQAVIDLDASNAAALELQQQAQALPLPPVPPVPPIQKSEAQRGAGARQSRAAPQETETPGIPRRANEPYADYTSRAVRIQRNYDQARDSLDKKKYVEAIGFLKELERDQSAFRDSGLMLADATTRQRTDFNEAMAEGQREQQAGRLLPAFRAYQRAEQIDKTQSATDRVVAVWTEMLKQANDLFTRANTAAKIGAKVQARDGYQKVVDLLPDGAELKERAQKGLEDLK